MTRIGASRTAQIPRQANGSPDWRAEMQNIKDSQRAAHPYNPNADRDPGGSSASSVPAGSVGQIHRQLNRSRDAGNTMVTADNANLEVLRHNYTAHRGMDMWVSKAPADGKLKMNMTITPSWHAGGDNQQKCIDFAKEFAVTNIYNLKITYPDGTSETKRFDVEGNENPKRGYRASKEHFATISPDFEIDMNKWKGKTVKIEAWAAGSAGAGGYVEARQTNLHL